MNKAYFEILRAGVNTTIQDKGRNHLYHVGIAVSGAIDQRNYTLSNKLVENKTANIINNIFFIFFLFYLNVNFIR